MILMANQILFWRWDNELRGNFVNVYFLVKYVVYSFSIIGVAAAAKSWPPIAIAAVVLNFISIVEIPMQIIVKDLRDQMVSTVR